MAEPDRTLKRPLRSPAARSMLAVVLLFITAFGFHFWMPGQQNLARWRIPVSETHWIASSRLMTLRYPDQGESVNPVWRLPLGDRSAIQFTHRLMQPPLGKVPMAVLAPAIDGRVEAFVNFAPVREGELQAVPLLGRPSSTSRIWTIPSDHFLLGENRIDFLVEGTASRAITAPIYLGPKADLELAAEQNLRMLDILRPVVLLLSLVAFVANLLAFALRAPVRHLTMAAAFAVAGTRVVLLEVIEPIGNLWPAVDSVLVAAMAVCAGLAIRFRDNNAHRTSLIEAGLLILIGLAGVTTIGMAINSATSGAVVGGVIAALLGTGYLIWTMIGVSHGIQVLPVSRQMLAGSIAGISLLIAALALAGIMGLIMPGPPYAPDLGLGAAIALLAIWGTAIGGSQSIGRFRILMDQAGTIRRQRAELKQATKALEAQTQQSAVLEERQRMARDVHDGIGGQLASLIAQVRMRRISMDHVEQALAGGLSELRFLVSSLDAVGVSLADALATFLDRAQQQAAAAGMSVEWSQPEGLRDEIREPQWILNLYRLMQEAVTNAVRHSGGDRIFIAISLQDGRIVIRIEDNGTGFDPASIKRGRGMTNMQRRASDLGGCLAIDPREKGKGAAIRIEAPLPR